MGFADTDLMALDTHTHDPGPFYRWLRDEAPLYWDGKNQLWAVSRFEDVVWVSKHPEVFCSGDGVIPLMGKDVWPDGAMINMDGDAHTCQRGLVSKGFTPRRIGCMEDRAKEIVNELIDAVAPRGEADLARDLARPLPMLVIGEMLGYPRDKMYDVLDWTDVYVHAGCGPDHINEGVIESFAKFAAFHIELLEQKKKNPGDDLLSVWLAAELDGQKLPEDTLLYEHNLLLVGGSETTRSAIAIGMKTLLEHPDQKHWLIENLADEEALNAAVEEMIRYTCPFVRMRRTATEDVTLHGKTIKKGDQLIMLYPAATRDPRAYDEPDRFDIRRKTDQPQIAFGYGKHFCLGASLARMETRLMVRGILERIPDLELAPGRAAEPHPSCFTRSLRTCPVVFRPVGVSAATTSAA
jgi:cytochrome P450 family 142 subfamily A polypeptide 1